MPASRGRATAQKLPKIVIKHPTPEKEVHEAVASVPPVKTDPGPKDAENSGTPDLKSFWLQALLKNHSDGQDSIFEYDEEVLEYLKDITLHVVDEADAHSGFKLVFHFVRNPFFNRNRRLAKECKATTRPRPFTVEIEWRSGNKNAEVEYVAHTKESSKNGTKKKESIPKMLDEYQEFIERLMQSDCESGEVIRDDYIAPYAMRWYTGEACPPMNHDD